MSFRKPCPIEVLPKYSAASSETKSPLESTSLLGTTWWPPAASNDSLLFSKDALNRYPKAPVAAPLANLPPPATEARPPSVVLATNAAWNDSLLTIGPANAGIAAESAPGPHLPPEAT